jgi:hypothetical protein
MGLFSSFLRPRRQPAAILTEGIERLQMGTLTNLTALYSSRLPASEALLLANCVLTYAMRVEPLGPKAQSYKKSHQDLVDKEAAQLSNNVEVAQALSYLYAALTIHFAIQTGDPLSKPAIQLGERATELSLYIPNTYDICGSGDALKCVEAVGIAAQNYMNQALGRAPSPK